MVNQLRKKSILITGGSSDIGIAIGKAFDEKNYKVILSGRNEGKLKNAISNYTSSEHEYITCDLSTINSTAQLIDQLKSVPDIIIHAIGGNLQAHSPDTEIENWINVFQLNLFSIINVNNYILKKLEASSSRATIIHISSSSAIHGNAAAPYGAAKAALNHYIKTLGRKYASKGITVTGIMPSAVEGTTNNWAKAKLQTPDSYQQTKDQQPLKRFQTPEEIANTCLFLSTPESSIFSGCVLSADATI